MALISTRELITKPLDTYLVFDEDTVCFLGVTEQTDGSVVVEMEYADAGAGRLDLEVAAQDLDEPFWDYDDNDN